MEIVGAKNMWTGESQLKRCNYWAEVMLRKISGCGSPHLGFGGLPVLLPPTRGCQIGAGGTAGIPHRAWVIVIGHGCGWNLHFYCRMAPNNVGRPLLLVFGPMGCDSHQCHRLMDLGVDGGTSVCDSEQSSTLLPDIESSGVTVYSWRILLL